MGNKQLANANEDASPAISPRLRWLLSAVIALHLLAVFAGPWAVQPSSQLANSIARWMEPYIEAACLNNGYRFFAPEPGPSHLVRYEVVAGDGQQVDGYFPDRKSEWPRLLYHRYFMMSEFLNAFNHRETANVYDKYAESYVRHLAHRYDAKSVNLYQREHRLPSIKDVQDGMKLDDPSLYHEELVTSWTPDDK